MHDVMAKPLTKSRSKISRQTIKKSPAGNARKASSKASPKSASKLAAANAAKGKWVYAFGGGKAAGRAGMRNLLGGKGAGLAEMAQLGLPVPPGFTITTEVCTYFYQHGKTYPKDLKRQVDAALVEVGRITGKKFGDRENPLLVSVRSGARASMPGMMDTVLNLGLNDVTVKALAAKSGDRRFAMDSYRRFITMYSDVVLGIDHHHFEEILDDHKDRNGYTLDTDLNADDLEQLVARYKERVEEERGEAFPQVPNAQLWGAIGAVFGSWMNQRAITYRRLHRGQCAGDGVRQYGRELGDRRRLYPQSLDRREKTLRRISDQCPGRGCRCRHPHAAGNHRSGA
jgi:pyruvate, orthophosphate dikinase